MPSRWATDALPTKSGSFINMESEFRRTLPRRSSATNGPWRLDTLRRSTGLSKFRIELLDEDAATTRQTISAYRSLLEGHTDASSLLDEIGALEKLGVTEGTLA